MVTVRGRLFGNSGIFCRFGAVKVAAIRLSSSELKCLSPRHTVGAVALEVSDNARDFSSDGVQFVYEQRRRILSSAGSDIGPINLVRVHPSRAPAGGGVEVAAIAKKLPNTDSLACRFGRVVVPATWYSDSQLRCRVPRHVPETVSFEISADGINFTHTQTEFTFAMESTIDSIAPSHGPVHGSTLVDIFGTHFANSPLLMCRFGEVRSQAVMYVTQNHVRCMSPAALRNLPGSVLVQVSNNNFTDVGGIATYTYDRQVEVDVLSPPFGPTAGGTEILVIGRCRIGHM